MVKKKRVPRKEPAISRDAMYLDDVKFLIDRKDLKFFEKIGAKDKIKDEKKFKQAKGLKKLYFKDDKDIVEAFCDASKLEAFIKKGGSETIPVIKKESK